MKISAFVTHEHPPGFEIVPGIASERAGSHGLSNGQSARLAHPSHPGHDWRELR